MILCFLKWYSGSCKCKCRNHVSQCLCKSILPPYSWAEHSVSVSDAVCHAVCQYLWCNAFWKTIKGCIYSDYLCVILKNFWLWKCAERKEKSGKRQMLHVSTAFHNISTFSLWNKVNVYFPNLRYVIEGICVYMCKSWDPVMTSCVRCLTKA